jgi:hypothetical protein
MAHDFEPDNSIGDHPDKVGWLVIYPKPGAERVVNVIPNFGREHTATMDCWCNPRAEFLDDGRILLAHECDN